MQAIPGMKYGEAKGQVPPAKPSHSGSEFLRATICISNLLIFSPQCSQVSGEPQ